MSPQNRRFLIALYALGSLAVDAEFIEGLVLVRMGIYSFRYSGRLYLLGKNSSFRSAANGAPMTQDERLLNPEQTARFLGLDVGTLANMRVRGDGPPYIAVSPRAIRYDREDLKMWVASRRRMSTSDLAAPLF